MATQVKVGAIIRRGAATISSETMRVLVENESKVEEITAEIDKRAAMFREQEAFAIKKLGDLEKAGADLATREAKLVDDRAALEAERKAAAEVHRSNMEALSRRTKEVAEWLGVSVQFLEIGRHRGYGPRFVRLGPRKIVYRRADVLHWLGTRTHASTREYVT